MAAGGLPPEPDPHAPGELLHESDRTRVTRVFPTDDAGRTVVRKQPVGPDAHPRLQHELAMLERLRGVEGVAQLTDTPRYPDSVVLADVHGTSLAGTAVPRAIDDLIDLGAGLARAVAGMHRCGVVHRDINPAHILLTRRGRPCIVDFSLATTFTEIRPGFAPHTELVGTPAYLAPEQTGRTGRSVDHRADLYALGATLYELATGSPPFGSGDPLRLTHDHLARMPVPPSERNPAVPGTLSAIILHLLEKEPDNRYQTAEGLLHDLEQLRDATGPPGAAAPRIGERDVSLRLFPPSRPVGRDREWATLQAAFEDALAGRCRGVLVHGPPGVGKTTLVDQMRAIVTDRDGWFVAGKFDQYRRDMEFNAVHQAFRALGRLLLAEPEAELAGVRDRILRAAGPNAGLVAATVPELATLLAVPPLPGDPLTAEVRSQQVGVQVLRAVASRKRPLVMFVDDLQWAARMPIGFVDLVLREEPIDGLLLVAAYRDGVVDTSHPLADPLSRWSEQAGLLHVRLDNLAPSGLAELVADMLHVDVPAAAGLAAAIEPRTGGNPYETVELLDALRRDGVLVPAAGGWRWDEAAVRRHLGRPEVGRLATARVDALPARSRDVVHAMACLGGRAEIAVLQVATGMRADEVERTLAPALADGGILVMEPGAHQSVRFRHDRVLEVIASGLDPQQRTGLQLAMARRLAVRPELFAGAAEQYLGVIDAVDDPEERRQVVALLRRAGDQAAMIGDYPLVNELLAAALRLALPDDAATLVDVHTRRHAALFCMGRLEDADEEFRSIERLCPTALGRADATSTQIRSLTHRNRFVEAVDLGRASLWELGVDVPATTPPPDVLDSQFRYLHRWLEHTDGTDAVERPDITDPTLLAAAGLLDAMLPAAYLSPDHATVTWLGMEALRIWLEHGPAPSVVGPASFATFNAVGLRGDRAAYRALHRILSMSEARGYEPATSEARMLYALVSCWFEPIEVSIAAAAPAREGLVAGGDLANAGYAYYPTVAGELDCAATLDDYIAEVDAGLAFARRTGSQPTLRWLEPHRWLATTLRGDGAAEAFANPVDRTAENPLGLFHTHLSRALVAAVLDDTDGLALHTAATMPLLPAVPGLYPTVAAHVLRGLALAGQARAADTPGRDDLLAELDEVTQWLAARATDAPDNLVHLLRLVEAERAWAMGDFRAALLAFDAARHEVARRRRPWHHALITERAGRFLLAHGVAHAGHDLLDAARRAYLDWGATAKVDQMGWAYPTLHTADVSAGGWASAPATVTTGTIDLLGILSASQALSSETSIERLHTRVVEVLGAMTGATGVHLLQWSEERQDWLLPAPGSVGRVAGHEHAVPMSVLRYAQRVREPLIVVDATRDDRFARDPYFSDLDCCALLALPIVGRGSLRALLVLENRFIRGAFTADRLDGITLIAGQLSVSLDNAQLYAELIASRARIVAAADQARRRIERNLHDGGQQRLVALALQLRAAQASVPPELSDLGVQLDDAVSTATGALDELRELARGIHPANLAEGGLRPALRALARRSPIPVAVDVHAEGRLPERIEVSAYYLVAEALTNAVKHADASAVTVTVDGAAVLRIAVQDNGTGGADPTRGTGLVGLKDRVEALGGRLTVRSLPGTGTTVQAEIPVDRPLPGLPEPG
jgi:signal transduction histidine kinase/energy-coupling factor transporter ATP-binding protein EcfA2